MEKKKIMVVCSAGMSTSLLVSNMEKAAKSKQLPFEIFALSGSDVNTYLEEKEIDVMLLGPQVRFMKKQFAPLLEPKGIPVEVISMKDYGLMDGESVLAWADKLMENQ